MNSYDLPSLLRKFKVAFLSSVILPEVVPLPQPPEEQGNDDPDLCDPKRYGSRLLLHPWEQVFDT